VDPGTARLRMKRAKGMIGRHRRDIHRPRDTDMLRNGARGPSARNGEGQRRESRDDALGRYLLTPPGVLGRAGYFLALGDYAGAGGMARAWYPGRAAATRCSRLARGPSQSTSETSIQTQTPGIIRPRHHSENQAHDQARGDHHAIAV